MNKEYEYSFKVTKLEPFIDYIKKHDYIKIEQNYQIRTLYKREDATMARITEKNSKIYLDFKDDEDSDKVLKLRRETLPIEVPNKNIALSIIDFLGYKESIVLKRERLVYKNKQIEFELDKYESPEKMLVVAIEGEKTQVDKVYIDIKDKFSEYILHK